MKKIYPLLLLLTLVTTSCFEDRDDEPIETSSVNDFVWQAMNQFYLYKSEIPDLADDRFPSTSSSAYLEYLNSFESTEALFNSLIFDRQNVDRFSWIVDDFFALEQNFRGVSVTSGMEIYRAFAPNSTTDVIGVVRLVLPESNADLNGLQRGDIFFAVNGIRLTEDNIATLLQPDTFTLNMGVLDDNGTPEDTSDDFISPTGEDITITKTEFVENPIFRADVIEAQGQNIGYLMYNGFIRNSDEALNAAFANFRANNIQELVLDLRYNPGGSVPVATALASMITGQFTGDVFQRLVFNETQQQSNTDFNYLNTLSSGASINSLGLNTVYVLATGLSASASEGLINGLSSYVNVIHIGSNTNGKTQASRTFYDSPDFSRQNPNPNHTYAIQPIIANGINRDGISVPKTGLPPNISYFEDVFNLGTIGNVNEPMLAIALENILGRTLKSSSSSTKKQLRNAPTAFPILNKDDFNTNEGGMFID